MVTAKLWSIFRKSISKFSISLGIVMSLLVFSSFTVLAGSGTLDNTDASWGGDYWEACSFTVTVTGLYTIPSVTSSTGNYVFVRVNTGPDILDTFTNVYGNTGGTTFTGTLTKGITYYAVAATTAANLPLNYNFTISGAGNIVGCGSSAPSAPIVEVSPIDDTILPPDNRINWQYGDLNAVVFEHEDGVAIYCYNVDTWLALQVSQALVDNADSTQAQDIPVQEYNENGCHVAFYILDSGEYQINIWSRDGKLYEIIADNLNFQNATMRYVDMGE